MIFLVDYDRRRGVLIEFRRFSDAEKEIAERARLEREISLGQEGMDREIVILDAASEEDLRKTHQRYFKTIEQIADSTMSVLEIREREL
jgi:hypothetical protein